MEKPKKLSVDWKTEGTDDKLAYVLQCTDPDYQELRVSVPADSVTERAARAPSADETRMGLLPPAVPQARGSGG